MCFKADAAKGKAGTKKFIAPVLKRLFGGEVVITENRLNDFERSLDCDHSIDGFVCAPTRGLLPFAARFQSFNYGSFPIRSARSTGSKTEYDKIAKALKEKSAMRPVYHAQGYAEGNGAVVAVVRTADLFSFIETNQSKTKIIPQADGTSIRAALWRDLKQAGVQFKKFFVSENGNITQI